MTRLITKIILLLVVLLISGKGLAKKQPLLYVIDIKKEISNTTRLYLQNGIKEADRLEADAILIHMNTYGGLVDAADSMRTAVLYNPIPVYVFIDNNAASAGALISIACDKIFMRKGANIGAATVVGPTGNAMPDKYQSYMRSMMRSTAEAHGKDTIIGQKDTLYKWKRDPLIAEAMVDERVAIPNLIDTGKVLTFTAEEAVKWGFCDGIVETEEEVFAQLGYTDYRVIRYEPGWLDNLKGFLMNPIFQGILIMIIIGGIYFELQTPGIGFPLAAATTAAVLYFAPLFYIDGLAAYWEILIFVIGIILIATEIFIIPGFGITGISGIVLITTGLISALLNNTDFDFEAVSKGDFGKATLTVLFGIVAGFLATIWLSNRIGKKGIFQNVALQADLEQATSSPAFEHLIGREGVAGTVLRPSGKVMIDGESYDGISESGFIEKGIRIVVTRVENSQIYVETR